MSVFLYPVRRSCVCVWSTASLTIKRFVQLHSCVASCVSWDCSCVAPKVLGPVRRRNVAEKCKTRRHSRTCFTFADTFAHSRAKAENTEECWPWGWATSTRKESHSSVEAVGGAYLSQSVSIHSNPYFPALSDLFSSLFCFVFFLRKIFTLAIDLKAQSVQIWRNPAWHCFLYLGPLSGGLP